MKKRWLRVLAGIAVVTIVAAAGYAFVMLRPVEVTVAEPERNVPIRVFGLGTVEARVISRIGFEVGGAVVALNADHGDAVANGDVLARLDTAEQEARVARAEAVVLAATVNVRKAEANVERARAMLAQRRETNKRKQALAGSSIVSRQSAEEAQRDEDIAVADLAVARAEVEVARANVTDAQAALAFERTVFGQRTLTAPFDAVIVERHTELGTVVKAGDVIYTLMAPETVWALAYIDESRAGGIVEGQPAEVRLRSLPDRAFPAHVVRIGVESDRVNEERRVWVKCDQCPPRFFLGEQAEVRITVATLDRALLVPENAVSGFDGRAGLAWIVRDGRLARVRLTFGHRTEDARLEVVGGLPDGGRIVTIAGTRLKAGRAARIAGVAQP